MVKIENKSNNIIDKAFFVIDSNNLDYVANKLYGYYIENSVIKTDYDKIISPRTGNDGSYVLINKSQDKISIMQDYIGSYGLYLYEEGEYFAISNSFLYLVEHIKQSHKITFNEDYANTFIVSDLCSVAYSETMINEIKMLDRCAEVNIDITKKEIQISYIDNKENTIEISSKRGMEMLDKWYFKWNNLIRNLSEMNNDIQVDLSGGFDSRLTFSLLLNPKIDMKNIQVNSINDNLHTHTEDYEIASDISKYYNFKLNNSNPHKHSYMYYSPEDIINISFYTKLCFHKQMYLKYSKCNPYRYAIVGAAGECIRAYWNTTDEEFIAKQLNRCQKYPFTTKIKFTKSVINILTSAFSQIKDKYKRFNREISSKDLSLNLYRETRCRNHFGKDMVESFLGGTIKLAPLLDSELQKLKLNDNNCEDKNLLIAIIFSRYNKPLLDFKFEGKRSINPETIKYAEEINERYPINNDLDFNTAISNITDEQIIPEDNYSYSDIKIKPAEVSETLKKIFYSKKTKNNFEIVYNEEIHKIIANEMETKKYFPLQEAYTLISISKIIQDTFINVDLLNKSVAKSLIDGTKIQGENSIQEYGNFNNYTTARIDIKNEGVDNNTVNFVEISDDNCRINTPKWFSKNGTGYIVESNKGVLNLKLECINNGRLKIFLRGKDVRNENNIRVPFWIDIQELEVNNKIIFKETKSVWHDKPYIYKCNVKNGEIVSVKVKWTPQHILNPQDTPLKHSNIQKSLIDKIKNLSIIKKK